MFCDVDIAFLQTFTLFKNPKKFWTSCVHLKPFFWALETGRLPQRRPFLAWKRPKWPFLPLKPLFFKNNNGTGTSTCFAALILHSCKVLHFLKIQKKFGLHVHALSPFSGHLKPVGYLKEAFFTWNCPRFAQNVGRISNTHMFVNFCFCLF